MDKAKYQSAYETLRTEILGGKYSSGNSFPSVVGASRRFSISRLTAVKVFDKLKADGLVCARSGSGTFVSRTVASRKIGLIVPGLCYSEIFPPICKELSRLSQKNGYALLLGDLSSNSPVERAKRAQVLSRQYVKEGVAGVIFQPIEFLENSEEVNRDILSVFDAANIPVVLLDCDIVGSPARSKYDIVGINNWEAGRRLAQHIVDQGVRSVVFLAPPHSDYSIQDRIAGAHSLVVAAKGKFRKLSIDVGDVASVSNLLTRKPRPGAIICRNDHQAAHLMVTLRKLERRVPEDVLVAGFNDVGYASVLFPGLTTIRLPCEDIARQAFSFLCERITCSTLSPRECFLSAPLVVRGSTGAHKVSQVKKRRIK